MTAAYPAPAVVWSRPRAGAVWHARRSHLDAAALCRYRARTGWVGAREVEPAAPPYPAGRACAVCLVRARDELRRTGHG